MPKFVKNESTETLCSMNFEDNKQIVLHSNCLTLLQLQTESYFYSCSLSIAVYFRKIGQYVKVDNVMIVVLRLLCRNERKLLLLAYYPSVLTL